MKKKVYEQPDFEARKFLTEDFAVTSGTVPGVDSNENETTYPSGWN